MTTLRAILITALLASLSLITSCEHKDLCMHHPHETRVRVEFDWRDAPDADPAGMCVFFYPENGGAPLRYDITGTEGREIEITIGRYRVLAYNNDSEAVQFRNTDDYDRHEGYTREGSVLEGAMGNSAQYAPRAAEEERVVITPDMTWGCTATDVEITEAGVTYICAPLDKENAEEWSKPTFSEYVITLYPHEMVCNYTYEIRNIENLDHVSKLCGALSGMSGSMFMTSERLHSECVTLPFESHKTSATTVEGQFYTFGHHEENNDPHRMLLYVWMNDDKKYIIGMNTKSDTYDEKFNVTDQIHNAPNPRRVHIIIDGLKLPTSESEGGGFTATVDDWIDVNVDIIM